MHDLRDRGHAEIGLGTVSYTHLDVYKRQVYKLGSKASHGCVRLSVEDAKWIYNHCPAGTTITVY